MVELSLNLLFFEFHFNKYLVIKWLRNKTTKYQRTRLKIMKRRKSRVLHRVKRNKKKRMATVHLRSLLRSSRERVDHQLLEEADDQCKRSLYTKCSKTFRTSTGRDLEVSNSLRS